jgi:DUF1365 family protein
MNSALYYCTVMHHRLKPLRHRFVYRMFMFYLDLDELDKAADELWFFSRHRRNVFSFRDHDHILKTFSTAKEQVDDYLRENGITLGKGKVFLLTNLRTFGYVFNPVSFYFCFDEKGSPLCTVAEVGNTFRELKLYFLGPESFSGESYRRQMVKYFYVSPFFDLDTTFDFMISVPAEKLSIHINDMQKGEKVFLSSLNGVRKELTNGNLFRACVRFPFVTLQVIGLIHFQALLLYLKKLPFHRKQDHPELQQEVYQWNK